MRDLSLHLMDIIQNSISANATKITVSVNAESDRDELVISIEDNGVGMDEEMLSRVTDPFVTTRTTRKVGIGIPLFKASAQRASGDIEIKSVKGKGTVLKAGFRISHIDRLPLGDIAETMVSVVIARPDIEFELFLCSKGEEFNFNSFEVKDRLGDVPITEYNVINWIREYIDWGVKKIFGGVLHEIDS